MICHRVAERGRRAPGRFMRTSQAPSVGCACPCTGTGAPRTSESRRRVATPRHSCARGVSHWLSRDDTGPSAVSVALDGVPETMLWTLYNRASEARRRDALLVDPAAVRICDRGPKKVVLAVLSRLLMLRDLPPAVAHVYT